MLLARTRSRAAALSLGAVAGGAAGNLADRLLRGPGLGSGSVVDWIHVAIYPATFNLADVAIRLGALCALIAYLRAATTVPHPGRTAGAQRQRRAEPGRREQRGGGLEDLLSAGTLGRHSFVW